MIRELLNRPELADLIIPDLARWEDWESLDKLVELFKTADTKSTWVREPIINFVRVCPLPAPKKALQRIRTTRPRRCETCQSYLPFDHLNHLPIRSKPPKSHPPTKPNLVAVNESTAQVTTQKPAIAAVNAGAKTAAAASKKNTDPPNLSLLWTKRDQ